MDGWIHQSCFSFFSFLGSDVSKEFERENACYWGFRRVLRETVCCWVCENGERKREKQLLGDSVS